ncbi:PspC domain-containing protein [Coprobacter secundus]|jgi:bacteriophage shock protein C|uniref:PspC domain-containing protein n=1 Tax=Coprobacter secundus TaxID=1501392 RepID=UPI0005742C77|nr:PspC domain-containing protein [Coprobacter secundus]KHM47346.1 hypothetical protein PU94_08185 [Coprobacter secundus]
MSEKKLLRSNNRIIAGVCGGLADYFDIDATLMRVIVVLAAVFTGFFPIIVAYVILIFVIPEAR